MSRFAYTSTPDSSRVNGVDAIGRLKLLRHSEAGFVENLLSKECGNAVGIRGPFSVCPPGCSSQLR